MLHLTHNIRILLLVFLACIFIQCNITKSRSKITKIIVSKTTTNPKVYSQTWVAGIRDGGSGVNLFIEKSVLGDIIPVQIYFKKEVVNVEESLNMYVARFKTPINQPKSSTINDYNMSNNPKDEYGNKVLKISTKPIFKLANDEAVISYLTNDELQYIKLIKIPEKKALAYPSVPPQFR